MRGERICAVNCGLPGNQCACFREQMREIYQGLADQQEPLGREFEQAIEDNIEDLYEP